MWFSGKFGFYKEITSKVESSHGASLHNESLIKMNVVVIALFTLLLRHKICNKVDEEFNFYLKLFSRRPVYKLKYKLHLIFGKSRHSIAFQSKFLHKTYWIEFFRTSCQKKTVKAKARHDDFSWNYKSKFGLWKINKSNCFPLKKRYNLL